jgi:Rps23 Pro-64 3,4-dihydroxylase Tpa1-like proline 4-hydroxylase
MIAIQDNFLPEAYLTFFKKQAANVPNWHLAIYGIWKNFFISEHKYISTLPDFGPIWHSASINIQTYIKEEHGINIYPYCARLQVCQETHRIMKHRDGVVRDSSLENSYSSIIYINDSWDNTHGGEIEFSETAIEPVYNRLVFYSRDELHSVLPPKKEWSKPRAIVMFSWDSDIINTIA